MSRTRMKLGESKDDVMNKLKASLKTQLGEISTDMFYANDVIYSLNTGENLASVGDAVMDLEEIIEDLPDISSKNRKNVVEILNNITFTEIPQSLQGVVREGIANFLKGRSAALAPIAEEKVSLRSVSDQKVTRYDQSIDKKLETERPKTTSLTTPKFVRLLSEVNQQNK